MSRVKKVFLNIFENGIPVFYMLILFLTMAAVTYYVCAIPLMLVAALFIGIVHLAEGLIFG